MSCVPFFGPRLALGFRPLRRFCRVAFRDTQTGIRDLPTRRPSRVFVRSILRGRSHLCGALSALGRASSCSSSKRSRRHVTGRLADALLRTCFVVLSALLRRLVRTRVSSIEPCSGPGPSRPDSVALPCDSAPLVRRALRARASRALRCLAAVLSASFAAAVPALRGRSLFALGASPGTTICVPRSGPSVRTRRGRRHRSCPALPGRPPCGPSGVRMLPRIRCVCRLASRAARAVRCVARPASPPPLGALCARVLHARAPVAPARGAAALPRMSTPCPLRCARRAARVRAFVSLRGDRSPRGLSFGLRLSGVVPRRGATALVSGFRISLPLASRRPLRRCLSCATRCTASVRRARSARASLPTVRGPAPRRVRAPHRCP